MGPLAQDVIFCIAENTALCYSCTCKLGILVVTSVTLITSTFASWEFVLFGSCMVAEPAVIIEDHGGNSA